MSELMRPQMDQIDTEKPPTKGVYEGSYLGINYKMSIKNPEIIEGYKQKILEIKNTIQSKNIEALKKLVGKRLRYFDFEEINRIFQDETLDDELTTQWAIGIWLISIQSEWKGDTKVIRKMITNKHNFLDDITRQENIGNCMDSSAAALLLAEQLGMARGKIRSFHGFHRFFDTGAGFAIDPWWAQKRGGLVRMWDKKDQDEWNDPTFPKAFTQHLCRGKIIPE